MVSYKIPKHMYHQPSEGEAKEVPSFALAPSLLWNPTGIIAVAAKFRNHSGEMEGFTFY